MDDKEVIDEIRNNVKDILFILKGDSKINGNPGIVAQVQTNKDDIVDIKKKPANIKNYLVAIAVIINTILLGLSLGGVI